MRLIQFGQSRVLFRPFTTQLWCYFGPLSYRKTSSITRGKSYFVHLGLFFGSFGLLFVIFDNFWGGWYKTLMLFWTFIIQNSFVTNHLLPSLGSFGQFCVILGNVGQLWDILGFSLWFLTIFWEVNKATLTLFWAFIVQKNFIYHKG